MPEMTQNYGDIEVQKLFKEIKVEVPTRPQNFSCDTICGFSRQANHYLESENWSRSARKLGGLIVFCLIFIFVEFVGGVKANSLAVLTDAAHLLTDILGFAISLFSLWASGWDATPRHSFGFFRLEVLGALFSVQLIWLICGILIYEAIDRLLNKNAIVNGKLMFATAVFGFLINILMVIWLGHDHIHHSCTSKGHDHGTEDPEHDHGTEDPEHDHGTEDPEHNHGTEDLDRTTIEETANLVSSHIHEHQCKIDRDKVHNQSEGLKWMQKVKQTHKNMNLQGAYLHVLGDLIQSIGVMIGGLIIWAKPNWLVVDLICTLGFSVLVLFTTASIIRNILGILMESTPSEIDVAKLEKDLKSINGVRAVHDLHVWALSAEKLLLSCHVTADPGKNSNEILLKVRNYCKNVYGIHHVTIQIEQE